jgi:hypothetical protein
MQFVGGLFVNDDKEVNLGNLQVIRCLHCYNSPMHVPNPNTKEIKNIYNIL